MIGNRTDSHCNRLLSLLGIGTLAHYGRRLRHASREGRDRRTRGPGPSR